MLPVYHLTEGLNQGHVRRIVKAALAEYGSKDEDELPGFLRKAPAMVQGLMLAANSDPTKAVMNADSHEYFAENTPVTPQP